MALAHSAKLRTETTNLLLVKILHEKNCSLDTFFTMTEREWSDDFNVTEKEMIGLRLAKADIPNCSFLAEDLLEQGFEVLPLHVPDYSKTLKDNLKAKAAPPILYVKGNKQILQEDSIAIVGARDASEIALAFADNIAKLASVQYKVVVSGFAKGVDKQALDSAIKYKGHSIIVLPQGIMTFQSGFNKYYEQIIDGDVLVLSTFHPKAPWSVQLAMARNPVIYGLAKEIYVAESRNEGGTWAGVIDGLRKGRKIYVRKSSPSEQNANEELVKRGAIPVDSNGEPIEVISKVSEATPTEYHAPVSDQPAHSPKPKKRVSSQKKKGKAKKDDSQLDLL